MQRLGIRIGTVKMSARSPLMTANHMNFLDRAEVSKWRTQDVEVRLKRIWIYAEIFANP